MSADYSQLPADLPVPEDDGAANHLMGMEVPALTLPSTMDGAADLGALASELLVAYVYPRTGTPGEPLPTGWNDIPGARGCTPQSCAYRDALAEFTALGAAIVGVSTQSPENSRSSLRASTSPFPCSAIATFACATSCACRPSRSRE